MPIKILSTVNTYKGVLNNMTSYVCIKCIVLLTHYPYIIQ